VCGSCAHISPKRNESHALRLLCGGRTRPPVSATSSCRSSKLRSDFNPGLYSNAGQQRAILRQNFASLSNEVFSRRKTGQSVCERDGSSRKYIVKSCISQLKFSRSGRFFPTFTIASALYCVVRRLPLSKKRILFLKGCKSLRHDIN